MNNFNKCLYLVCLKYKITKIFYMSYKYRSAIKTTDNIVVQINGEKISLIYSLLSKEYTFGISERYTYHQIMTILMA